MYLVPRVETFVKLFFFISCTGLFFYAFLAFYTFHTSFTTVVQVPKQEYKITIRKNLTYKNTIKWNHDLKYILFWTHFPDEPANTIPEGQSIFTNHKCGNANCFITINKKLIRSDYTNFDAIVFNISVIENWNKLHMPQRRSQKQKYVFYSLKSSDDTSVCNVTADSYFNWTWTYKLNSDIVSPFIEVTDLQGNIVAPKLNVDWVTNTSFVKYNEINNGIVEPKQKAVALLIDKCKWRNRIQILIEQLHAQLKTNHLDIEVLYGCRFPPCPISHCVEQFKKYYFYVLYEDNIAEDYVTTRVLKGFKYGGIPIIRQGGADYNKFLPDGSYIDARKMSDYHLAIKIIDIVKNPVTYHSYFTWKKWYSIDETRDLKGICNLCALLNDKAKVQRFSGYTNFRKWWYSGSLYHSKCSSKDSENVDDFFV